jgi:hypothetical protein
MHKRQWKGIFADSLVIYIVNSLISEVQKFSSGGLNLAIIYVFNKLIS